MLLHTAGILCYWKEHWSKYNEGNYCSTSCLMGNCLQGTVRGLVNRAQGVANVLNISSMSCMHKNVNFVCGILERERDVIFSRGRKQMEQTLWCGLFSLRANAAVQHNSTMTYVWKPISAIKGKNKNTRRYPNHEFWIHNCKSKSQYYMFWIYNYQKKNCNYDFKTQNYDFHFHNDDM